MKNSFKWHKEQLNGKWFSVCDHEHVPMIEHTKDGKYKVRNANVKAILHEKDNREIFNTQIIFYKS